MPSLLPIRPRTTADARNMINRNATFLAAVTKEAKDMILGNIAAHYGITPQAAFAEVTAPGAEHLLDYMVEPERSAASTLMQAYGMRGY